MYDKLKHKDVLLYKQIQTTGAKLYNRMNFTLYFKVTLTIPLYEWMEGGYFEIQYGDTDTLNYRNSCSSNMCNQFVYRVVTCSNGSHFEIQNGGICIIFKMAPFDVLPPQM